MIVAIIPAKSNSVGIPNKNITELGGRTLIQRAVTSANIPKIDKIFISTDIENITVEGVDEDKIAVLPRPRELTLDNAQVNDVVSFSVRQLNADGVFPHVVVVLQPTSPFRTSKHVSDALSQYVIYPNFDNCLLSGYWQDKFTYEGNYQCVEPVHHDAMYRKGREFYFSDSVFMENGAIYIAEAEYILTHNTFRNNKMVPFEMTRMESIELDSLVDWAIAETFLEFMEHEHNS